MQNKDKYLLVNFGLYSASRRKRHSTSGDFLTFFLSLKFVGFLDFSGHFKGKSIVFYAKTKPVTGRTSDCKECNRNTAGYIRSHWRGILRIRGEATEFDGVNRENCGL